MEDLLRPTTEVTRAIAAVAQGNLTQTVRLDVDGRPLEGEFLRSANIVNTMIQQLSVFTAEVTRVAREVGTDGKLGGQAQVPGVAGTWKDLTDSVNSMASNLTGQVRNIAEVATAVASGDLSRKITVDVRGEILQLKEAINTMVDQLRSFASEVTRVAREVGTDGKLGGQAVVPGVAGTWKDLTDSVNAMAGNLTAQVRNIAEVTTAVARGDLSRKITVDVKGEILELKDTINTMVDQLNAFAGEVTRVAREVGTEGKLGGQAQVPGVGGTWKDLTDNVNFMASNLTGQVRNIAEVATAIASGDLSRKITVDVRGEILQLKETLNTMVDQLNRFAGEVTRVAREVGTEGRLGGQANVPGVAGTWKDLTDSVNSMAGNLTGQVRNIAEVTTAVARGDLSRKITVDVKGEILELKNTINTMVDQLNAFAGEVTRVAREVGTEGKLGGQAQVPGRGRHLERPHRQRQLHGQQPDRPGAQHRRSGDRRGPRRLVAQDHGRREGRNSRTQGHHQHDGGPVAIVRFGSDARGPRSRHRRQARRPGAGAGRGRNVEGPYRLGQLDGQQPDRPGAQHRRSVDAIASGDLSKKITVNVSGEILLLKETINTMVDQLNAFAGEVTRVAREVGTRRPTGRTGQRARRGRHVEGSYRLGQLDGRKPDRPGAQHRRSHDRRGARRLVAQDHRRRERRNSRAEEHHQHDGGPAQRVRRRSHARGARSGHRRQAGRPGRGARRRRNLEGSHRQRELHGQQPDWPGAQHRRSGDGHRHRRLVEEDHRGRARRNSAAQRNAQHHGRAVALVRRRSDARGARSRQRRPAGRTGQRARRGRHVERSDRLGERHGRKPDGQVRNIAEVTTAVARGDLSRKITVDVKGEILELKNTINTMVDQLNAFAAEVTRVAREVGTEGKLGGQAQVPGVAGTWKDLTDNVNVMAANLTEQVRGIVKVVTAVANGELTQKLTVNAKGEVAALAETINNMTDTLATFADQVTTVAREVGVEGRLGGQANVPGAAGTWKDLTGNVNLLADNLTNQVRAIAEVATAVTKGDLTRSIQVEASGEVAELKDNINTMIDNLRLTTERNTEQDWLKTNLARFTGMLQGQRDLTTRGPDAAVGTGAAGRTRSKA